MLWPRHSILSAAFQPDEIRVGVIVDERLTNRPIDLEDFEPRITQMTRIEVLKIAFR